MAKKYNKISECVYPHKYGCRDCEHSYNPELHDGGCKLLKKPDIVIFKCPYCGVTCEPGVACSCSYKTNFNVLEERRGKGLIVVGYTDAKGNIWRFR